MIKKIGVCIMAVLLSVSLCACKQDSHKKTETFTTFKDSLGRSVKLPHKIKKYAVTGVSALIPCFAVEPDKLVALPSKWSSDAEDVLDKKYLDMPVIGQLFGGKSELDKETLMSLNPDVIIDVGEKKDGIGDDLDEITKQTGIPCVFVDMDFLNPQNTFFELGVLFDKEEKAKELSNFTQNIIKRSQTTLDSISDKKKVLYCLGDNGCNVIAKDSYHSTVIDLVGDNIAVVDNPSSKGLGNEVDFEQIMNWNPDYIVFDAHSIGDMVSQDKKWSSLDAVKNNNYVVVPDYIYNFLGFPPSMQRYLGLMFLETRLYPDKFEYNLDDEIVKFYKLYLQSDVIFDEIVK